AHYHGVEHKNSTVLVLGPNDRISERKPYRDLLGVASHELFHVWNVTRIRPQEMMPYDFSREAYHPSGYITEGVTMYFGDLMLARAGAYSVEEYIEEVNVLLRVHGQNFGKENMSMVESSKDLWLDGYTPGAPERRQSIYVEGFVLALALDMEIRFLTQGQQSLENVMHLMWINYGQKNIGYSDSDYWSCVTATVPNLDLNEYYGRHYELSESVLPRLAEIMPQMVGYQLVETAPTSDLESRFGLRLQAVDGQQKVTKLDPKGPAYTQLTHGDIISQINGSSVEEALENLGDAITLEVVRPLEEVTITLEATGQDYLTWQQLEKVPEDKVPEVVKRYFPVWLKHEW
ncbi:MAG TPA: hypothetical protein DCE41_21195, partial [Cytophagales bacterium]|nr:hypothetical protein [Cytophagales bacterium]